MAKEVQRVAREESQTRSELFREALRQYIATRSRWRALQQYGAKQARKLGIKESDIERLIDEYRSGTKA
jgi:CopG family transcriptional regulator/antitoxin EndoAI